MEKNCPDFVSPTRRHVFSIIAAVIGSCALGAPVASADDRHSLGESDLLSRKWFTEGQRRWFFDQHQWLSGREKRLLTEIEDRWLSERHWISENGRRWTSEFKDGLRSDRRWVADRNWWPGAKFGSVKSSTAQCLLRGTRILTANEEKCVEELEVGELVVTRRNARLPVRRIHNRIVKDPGPAEFPVMVSKYALDEKSPHADLYLTSGHSLYLNNILIPVGELINGKTIMHAWPSGLEGIEYFHVELDTHEVIFAEGAPVETLLEKSAREHAMTPYAPIAGYHGGRAALKALIRLAAFPVVDIRDPIQVAFDQIAFRTSERLGQNCCI